ncbi:MAG: hypothetical protein HY872_00655 [Chloroflexi bacterium]|nr:hypothetical protein [Chloroflexota bacterium]MBI5828461.1 hypothetical protein [Chloroflexota bacterium]
MAELIVLVMDDPNKADEIVNAWLEAGVSGVTMLDSAGLGHFISKRGTRDDLPVIPSLASLLRSREETNRTLFTVVPDNFDVEALAAATEKVTGTLDDPDTGILFVIPVRKAWGLHRRRR